MPYQYIVAVVAAWILLTSAILSLIGLSGLLLVSHLDC